MVSGPMRVSGHYRTIFPAILAALFAACAAPDAPEQAVRAWLERAEAAAEARDRGTLVDMISERYVDSQGNDRAAIGRRLGLYFMRHRHIAIISTVEELAISGGSAARVVLTATLAGTGQNVLDLGAEALRFELELELEDGAWRLIGARWRER